MSGVVRMLVLLVAMITMASGNRFDVVEVDAPYFPTDDIVTRMMTEMKELLQEDVMQKLEEVQQKIVAMEQKVDAGQQNTDALQKNIELVKEKVGLVEEQVSAVVEKVGLVEEQVSAMVEKVGLVEQQVSAVVEKVGLVEEQVSPVVEKVGLVEAAVEQNGVSVRQKVAAASEAVEQKVAASETALARQLATLATHQQLVETKAKISTMISSTNGQITEAMADLVTVARLEEVVAGQIAEVVQECSSCSLADTMAQVLAKVTDNQQIVNYLEDLFSNTSSTNTQVCESLSQEIERLATERGTENAMLGASVSEVQAAVLEMNMALGEILNYTRPPPPPPPTTTPAYTVMDTEDQREMTPCEDSTFVGRRPEFDVCAAAVRFRKCRIHTLAYHCCQSCTRSGQIPERGPWRHVNYPRVVKFIDAIQLMRRL